jgi:hypothetical protein
MQVPRKWRKRMGVEPTKDRLAAPPGFEVRTPHRGRLSSNRSNINHYTALARRTNSGRRVAWPQVGPKLFRSCSCDRLCDRAKYTGWVGVCLPCPLDVNPEESVRVILGEDVRRIIASHRAWRRGPIAGIPRSRARSASCHEWHLCAYTCRPSRAPCESLSWLVGVLSQ